MAIELGDELELDNKYAQSKWVPLAARNGFFHKIHH